MNSPARVSRQSSWRSQGVVSAVALYDCGSLELARQYGVVAVDSDGRVTEFVEKPAEPPSTLVAIATYIYHRNHVELVDRYLDEGGSPDAPGSFIAWLCSRQVVYGYRFVGAWFDIGDREQLLAADNELRVRAGLPPREAYDPGPAQG